MTKYYHNTVVGYSYSKSLSIPGERIGYLVIPDEVDESGELITAASIANRVLGLSLIHIYHPVFPVPGIQAPGTGWYDPGRSGGTDLY